MRITESQLRQIIREELHEMKALPPGPAFRRPTLNPHDKAGMERLAKRYQSMWDDPEFSDDDEDERPETTAVPAAAHGGLRPR